jgi:hypothetical protein
MPTATVTSDRWPAPTPARRANHRRKPSLAHNLLLVGAISAVLALLIWGGLAVQLATGGDPALGDTTTTAGAAAATSTPTTTRVLGDDESDDGGVVVVPPAPAPVQSTPTPVQTSVS